VRQKETHNTDKWRIVVVLMKMDRNVTVEGLFKTRKMERHLCINSEVVLGSGIVTMQV
jgi:IS1 family transposase